MQNNISPPKTFQQTYHTLRDSPDCRFVGPREYCKLLISTKHLERCDEQMLGIRGVFDPQSGTRFLIEEEELS